jgi:hypothetical protein
MMVQTGMMGNQGAKATLEVFFPYVPVRQQSPGKGTAD